MTEAATIQTIIQGGAVGLAVLLIIYAGWKDKMFNKTLNNHLQHFTDALDRNSNVIGQNNATNQAVCKLIERMNDKIDKM